MLFSQRADDLQNVEGPASFLSFELLQRAKSQVSASNVGRRTLIAGINERDARVDRDSVEKDVAADPTCSACCERKGLSTLKHRQGKSKSRDENDCSNGPRSKIVVQDEKIWCAVLENGSRHFRISGVEDS